MNDLIGQQFGRLTVVRRDGYFPVPPSWSAAGKIHGQPAWICECDCGIELRVRVNGLKSGNTTSCGCYRLEIFSKQREVTKYKWIESPGIWRHPNYVRCRNAIDRCHNPESKDYVNWGARGISVYQEWRQDIAAFCTWLDENLGPCPLNHTMDRIDNDGDYEPGNLRWATWSEQNRNRRDRKTVELVCAVCDRFFDTTEPYAKYCSTHCKNRAYRVRHDLPVRETVG